MATPRTSIPNDKTSSAYHTQPKTSSAYYTQLNTSQPSCGVMNRLDNRPVYNDPTDNGAAATTAPASAFVDARVNDSTRFFKSLPIIVHTRLMKIKMFR